MEIIKAGNGFPASEDGALREAVEKRDAAMFDRESRRIQAALAAGTAKLREAAR